MGVWSLHWAVWHQHPGLKGTRHLP
ncbi:hypothetical protein A6R68_00731 [Neotoma lepida]|uniref:Uncharacterized protein n=1 Tax=Neotoma lepida TaxID=56216 RepID=A0A1A6GX31_NEOLE|nr:hypothetical protein A6R68_00731 [Neotoma lepida]